MDFIYCDLFKEFHQITHTGDFLLNIYLLVNVTQFNGSCIVTYRKDLLCLPSSILFLKILNFCFTTVKIIDSKVDQSLHTIFIVCDILKKRLPTLNRKLVQITRKCYLYNRYSECTFIGYQSFISNCISNQYETTYKLQHLSGLSKICIQNILYKVHKYKKVKVNEYLTLNTYSSQYKK